MIPCPAAEAPAVRSTSCRLRWKLHIKIEAYLILDDDLVAHDLQWIAEDGFGDWFHRGRTPRAELFCAFLAACRHRHQHLGSRGNVMTQSAVKLVSSPSRPRNLQTTSFAETAQRTSESQFGGRRLDTLEGTASSHPCRASRSPDSASKISCLLGSTRDPFPRHPSLSRKNCTPITPADELY